MSYLKTIRVRTTDLRIKVPIKTRSLNPLEINELVTLRETSREAPLELQLMIDLAIRTGVRLNEVATFQDNLIFNPENIHQACEITIGPSSGVKTKYGVDRNILMPGTLMQKLYLYKISERRQKRIFKECISNATLPLFINQKGLPYNPKAINTLWLKLIKVLKSVQKTPFNHDFHDLRATYGTYKLQADLENGINATTAMNWLMNRMGHKHERTTWLYLIYLQARKARMESIAMLDAIMDGAISDSNA